MTQNLESMLRKALDEADRYRRRVLIVSTLLAATVAGGLFWLDHLSRTADVKTMLVCAVATVLVGQVTPAVITWGIVSDATRKILKSIELLSRE